MIAQVRKRPNSSSGRGRDSALPERYDRPRESFQVLSAKEAQKEIWSPWAYGAFVHALEDEFESVRSTALSSIGILARSAHPDFLHASIPFILDMFNDEEDAIRLLATQELEHTARERKGLRLNLVKLNGIIGALEDPKPEVRSSLYRLLTWVHLEARSPADGVSLLEHFILAMLSTLIKHPSERAELMISVARVSAFHASWILPKFFLEDMAKSSQGSLDHPHSPDRVYFKHRLLTHPRRLEDPAYVMALTVIFNGASRSHQLLSHLPRSFFDDYLLLWDRFPSSLPSPDQLESPYLPQGIHHPIPGSSQLMDQLAQEDSSHLITCLEHALIQALQNGPQNLER